MSIVYDNEIMKPELYDYDVYPMCFLTNVEKTITIKPLGIHRRFTPSHTYIVRIMESDRAEDSRFPGTENPVEMTATPDGDGCLRIKAVFPEESMYFIRLYNAPDSGCFAHFCVYALAGDMAGRYP